jgi:primosomal protein N' (replication factor Y) (superfamily II helicase)
MYAEIIIPLHLPKNYTWRIPDNLMPMAQIGVRVEVELRRKKYTGIVCSITEIAPEFEAKDILSILDDKPIIYPMQLQLWQWIAQYYMCSQGDVMQAALPAHLKLNSESIIVFNEEYGDNFMDLGNDEYMVAEALHIKKELKLSEIQTILDAKKVFKTIKILAQKNICFIWESLKDKYTEKKETYVLLQPQYNNEEALSKLLNEWTKAPKQMELLLSYLHYLKLDGVVTKKDILQKANATDAQLKGLVEKGVLLIENRTITRLAHLPLLNKVDIVLSDAQQVAYSQLQAGIALGKPCLLHGITGSGKTLLYIKLLEQVITKGQQALYLLPEIALTAQLIRRLQQYFGGNIAVYHSKLNDNERVELWNKVKSLEIKIVIGARTSLLLPYCNLQLIIVDEEHENTFKQFEPAPRYNAKDAAIFLASKNNIPIVLGSATPSVESYYNALQQKYVLINLTERYGGVALPKMEIVDMKAVQHPKNERTILSPALQLAVNTTIQNNKQVILFKNRRGYTPYNVCAACGWIPECKHCKVSLTYHKNKNHLICHYCSTNYALVNTCVACGNTVFESKSYGTEKLEEAVIETFKNAKVGRMDVDSVKGKNAHQAIIQQLEQGKINILVGTQMVVKGLDFERVQLVGIVDADSMLNYADFRVNERAFQLMEQVSGRAGRKQEQGIVLIQVYNTNHPLLPYLIAHDYNGFYVKEISERELFFYPPFSRLIQVQIKHKNQVKAQQVAHFFAKNIDPVFQPYIIGPAEPAINKIRNLFIMELLFKLPKDTNTINRCKFAIQKTMAVLVNVKEFSGVVVIANVDPV